MRRCVCVYPVLSRIPCWSIRFRLRLDSEYRCRHGKTSTMFYSEQGWYTGRQQYPNHQARTLVVNKSGMKAKWSEQTRGIAGMLSQENKTVWHMRMEEHRLSTNRLMTNRTLVHTSQRQECSTARWGTNKEYKWNRKYKTDIPHKQQRTKTDTNEPWQHPATQ